MTAPEMEVGRGRVRLHHSPENRVILDLTHEPATVQLGDFSLRLNPYPEPMWMRGAVRLFDVALSVILLASAAPVFAVLWMVVRATSPGRAIYTSERLGLNGVPFRMLKFRTMVDSADQLVLPDSDLADAYAAGGFKIRRDPRVTKVGRVLRKLSLDELPQLVNVVRGEMSICGPRPKIASEGELYGAALMTVLRIRPGITGRWQVSGRNEIEWNDRVMMDIEYALTRTIREDAWILCRTAFQVVAATGGEY